MKVSDFKKLVADIENHAKGKTVCMSAYNHIMLTKQVNKTSGEGLQVTIADNNFVNLQAYNLYDLTDKGYQDSKDTYKNTGFLTYKQRDKLQDMFLNVETLTDAI